MPDSQLSKDVRDIAVELARNTTQTEEIQSTLVKMEQSLQKMNQAIFTGNGQKSIIARVEGNEVKIASLQGKVDKIEETTDIIAIETKRIDKKHSLGLVGLVLVFCLVIFDYSAKADIIVHLINLIK